MIEFVRFVEQYHVGHLTMAAVGAGFVGAALVDQARLRQRSRREPGPRLAAAGVSESLAGGGPRAQAGGGGRAGDAGRGTARRVLRETRLRHLAALLTLVAGVIHLLVAPEHFAEGLTVGALMAAAGTAQVVAGVLLWRRPSRLILAAALAGTLGILAVYAVSRTTGLPIGPTPWVPERVGTIDLASKVTEVEFVATAVLLLALGRRPAAGPGPPRLAGAGRGEPDAGLRSGHSWPALHRRLWHRAEGRP
jgi:hypothetical protein